MVDETACPGPLSTTLIHGDCLHASIDGGLQAPAFAFCDVPYAITACRWDIAVDLEALWERLAHVLAPQAVVVFSASMLFAQKVTAAATFKYKYDLVWEKARATGFLSAKKMPLRAHEHLLIFGRGKTQYTPQMVEVDDPRRGPNIKKGNNGRVYGGLQHGRYYEWTDKRYPRSIINHHMPRAEQGHHPTQKPVALLDWLVRTYTKPGDTILDPCAGSGTTAVAALRVGGGRKAICIEKDAGYFEVMRKRVDAERAAMGLPPADCR